MTLRIFACVPADARARAALVCRAWRDAIAEPSVWAQLDLDMMSVVTVAFTDAVLRGAAARAQGQLTSLLLRCSEQLSIAAVLDVVTANAGSLRELTCWSEITDITNDNRIWTFEEVADVARAAPQLRVLHADVSSSVADALHMLRNDSPFEPLRIRDLEIDGADDDEPAADADVLAFVAAVQRHASLRQLGLFAVSLRTPAVLDALAAVVTASALPALWLVGCGLSPASVPALVRMLRRGALTSLELSNNREALLVAPLAVQFADAIASHHALRHLRLEAIQLWHDAPAAAAVMRAVTGHPSLQTLELTSSAPPDPAAAGAMLGALVAADAPALRELCIHNSPLLGDAGMRPLLDALAHNTHLRMLDCCDTGMSDAFAHVFLPAVRANTSLRTLEASKFWGNELNGVVPPAVLEAEALVAARSTGGGALVPVDG